MIAVVHLVVVIIFIAYTHDHVSTIYGSKQHFIVPRRRGVTEEFI